MPAPVIPTLTAAPPAPLRSQAPVLYTMTAETFVDWQGDFPTEMNAVIAAIEAYGPYLEGLTGSSGPIISTALTMGTGALLGRTTAGDGTIEEITIGAGLSLAAGVLSATGGTYTDEMARDAIGTALVEGAGITITVNDGADTITIAAAQTWDFNFADAGDAYILASEAMTITEQDTTGTGTVAYEKSTNAAPDTFASATSPVTLEAGAKLKVTASTVTATYAVHLARTA